MVRRGDGGGARPRSRSNHSADRRQQPRAGAANGLADHVSADSPARSDTARISHASMCSRPRHPVAALVHHDQLDGDADPQTPEPRLYRVYETPEQLTLLLTLANESSEIIFFDQTGLERDVRFRVTRDGRNFPITPNWHPDTRQAGRDGPVFVSPGSSTRMDPGKGVEWRIDLQPADATTFPVGRYAIEIALGDARGHVSTAAGQPWTGAALRSASVSVIVARRRLRGSVRQRSVSPALLRFEETDRRRPCRRFSARGQQTRPITCP